MAPTITLNLPRNGGHPENGVKIEAVKLVTEKGYSVAEAVRSLGIGENLRRSWKAAGDQAFPGHGHRAGTPPAPCRQQTAPHATRPFKNSGGLLCQGGPVIFSFIEQHKNVWPIALLCDTHGLTPCPLFLGNSTSCLLVTF